MVITCKKACKKKRSTMLTVEQMADIALGTPEIGAVNFNVLHALIHVIIQQLNIQKCLVEFKGYDSERMEGIILTAKPGPILKLSEYLIDTGDGKGPCAEKFVKRERGEAGKDSPGRKPPCECTGKRKSTTDEKEKSDKEKGESDVEEKRAAKSIKQEQSADEAEEEDESEHKKVREVTKPKTKFCPCKAAASASKMQECPENFLKTTPSGYYDSDAEGTCQTIVRVEPVGEKCDSWRSRPALAHQSMIKLEEKVAMLQDAFEALEQMPTNEELKKRAQKTNCVSTPVKDLWQLYNLNKRVESCEGTIEKLASMIEDLVKETCNFREAMLVIADAVDDIECSDNTGRECGAALQGRSVSNHQADTATAGPTPVPKSQKQVSQTFTKPMERQSQTVSFQEKIYEKSQNGDTPPDSSPVPPTKPEKTATIKTDSPSKPGSPHDAAHSDLEPAVEPVLDHEKIANVVISGPATFSQENQSIGTAEDRNREDDPDNIRDSMPPSPEMQDLTVLTTIGPEFNKMTAGEKFCILKKHIDCLTCQFKAYTQGSPSAQIASKLCAVVSMQKQLDNLEKEWRSFLGSFGGDGGDVGGTGGTGVAGAAGAAATTGDTGSTGEPTETGAATATGGTGGAGGTGGTGGTGGARISVPGPAAPIGLSKNLSMLKADMEEYQTNVMKLMKEKSNVDSTIKNILATLETLKKKKADLELVEDLLAGKADAAVVNRKVSHDQFDAACDDLTRGLDEALERLLHQEALYNEAMEELQKDLDNKLDKNEIMPLKEFINKKLKCLQEKLKDLAQLKKDAEAAGAKSRILRNLNCLVCDGDVVMKMDNKSNYQHPSAVASRTVKPMLTYELEQVRKAMRKGPQCRGGSHIDDTIWDGQRKAAGYPLTTREAVDSKISKLAHFCNRYCGGSHTITTPQQRVTRIGHFLTEFGPQALALLNADPDCKPTPPPPPTQNGDGPKPC